MYMNVYYKQPTLTITRELFIPFLFNNNLTINSVLYLKNTKCNVYLKNKIVVSIKKYLCKLIYYHYLVSNFYRKRIILFNFK